MRAQPKWWLADDKDGKEACARLWTWVERLRGQWAVDGLTDIVNEAIYADMPLATAGTFNGRDWSNRDSGGLCLLNVIKSLVNTAASRLTKVRSMPCITARNAEWEEQEFAVEVSAVLREKMGAQDLEEAAALMIRDMCIRAAGVAKVTRSPDGGDTATERIPVYEVIYDRRESQLLKRLTARAHVRPESRDEMMSRYPDFADKIAKAPLYTRIDPWMQYVYQGPSLADIIEVAESWHPPSSPGADDGQHIVCVRGACVLREPWLAPRDPLVFAWWTAPLRGGEIRGQSIVDEQCNSQDFINGILRRSRIGIEAASQLKIFAPRGANVNKHHLDEAEAVSIVEVDGAPGQVQFVPPDPVSKQAWAIAFQMETAMYNNSGIPQWQAAGKSALGNNVSGKALDTMDDSVSDRFAQVETGWQMARVGIGRAHLDMARHIHDEFNGKLGRRFPEQPKAIDKKRVSPWIRTNEWDQVDIDGGGYHLTLEPVNFIGGTRGGKLEDVAEAAKAGLIPDPTMTADLFNEPDIQRMNRSILGPIHRIKKCMSGLRKLKVEYMTIAPDANMNWALAKLMCNGEREEAMACGAPDDVIERYDRFLSDLEDLEKKASASAAPSLAGAQSNTTINQGNAATLMGGGGMPPPMPPGPGPQGAAPMPPGIS